jgi:tripeptide aminopeptidase
MTGLSSPFLYTVIIRRKGDGHMKSWNQLFIRQGFMVEEIRPNVFVCLRETEENMAFLIESLEKLSVSFVYEKGLLSVTSPVIDEESWLACVNFKYRGRGEGLWFRPGMEQPKVKELDTYIAGLVRQLNRLGFITNGSCDGHERRSPSILFTNEVDLEKVIAVLLASGVPRIFTRNRRLSLNIQGKLLLDITEKLSCIQKEWLEEGIEFIRKQFFYLQLEHLLSIPGESGNEAGIRRFVIEKLRHFVDYMTIDPSGNLLAKKTYGTGHGPTILLNAHLDTVDWIQPDRTIVKNGPIWSSDRGILGADDRAGVAVLLETAQRLQSPGFNGRVKFIFTVEEEIGLIGARRVNETFLWDVDARNRCRQAWNRRHCNILRRLPKLLP